MPEAPTETTVRLGPAVANLLRSIWRQRELVILGLLLGLALGYLALPKVLGSGSTYQATQRMDVRQGPADAIGRVPPAIGPGLDSEGAAAGASPDVLKDYQITETVVKQLRIQDELPPTTLLNLLTFTPLQGTSLVDLSFTHRDPRLAASVVNSYATRYVAERNRAEEQRFTVVIRQLESLATDMDTGARPGVPLPSTELRSQIAKARAAKFLTGDPTAAIGEPIVTTNGPPLSRKVTIAIGLLLGLGIGAGAALLVETANRKVITPADAEEASDLPFIADVRKAGIRRRSPLPVVDRPFSPAAEDYRRVGTALERQGLGGDIRVLAIVSADPGDGKSLLAANLAHSLARQGREVVLVSSDLRHPQVEKLLGLGQHPGLAEALQDEPIPAIALLVSINHHLLVLPAGLPSKHPGELLASKRLHETVQALRQVGIVILDTPAARLSADALALSGVADATLLVARSGVTRMRSVYEAASGLRRDRIRQLGVVLVGTSGSMARSLSQRFGGYRGQPEVDEVAAPSLPVQLSPRPAPASDEQEDDKLPGVAELNVNDERKRRAAE
ncbi:MAG TPA: CpsD/CapB family tyrosine-protein kinase [Actinomycetes bacterium]|nr:CpsD/CapB family tyrosine-protein kinase [Actinomycetes bacterium]